MSILLDIGEDLAKLNNTEGLVYKNIVIEDKYKDKFVYILIKEKGLKIIDLDIEDDVEEFSDKLKLVLAEDMNKCLMTKGKYKKQNMSISPLSINFNMKTLRKNLGDNWKSVLVGINEEGFRILKENIDDEGIDDKVKYIQEFCNKSLENNLEELEGILVNLDDSKKVRMLFDVDIEYFKEANKLFYFGMNKIFAKTKDIVEYNGETYGYNSFINCNNKKPFLISKIKSNKSEIYNISLVKNVQNPFKINEILSYEYKKAMGGKEYYWEYDTKEPENNIKKNNYVGKNKLKATGKASIRQLGQYYIDDSIKGSKKNYYDRLFKSKSINLTRYKSIESAVIKKMMKELKTGVEKLKVIHNLNILFSIKEYYGLEGVDIMSLIKGIQENNDIKVNNDKDYSYLLGQVVYYVNSQGKEASEKHTMGYIYKYINNRTKINDNLLRDMSKYRKYIRSNKKFSEVVSELMKHDLCELDKGLFLAGVLDTNIFYQKQNTEENNNKGEM